jgi:hypothetical protein
MHALLVCIHGRDAGRNEHEKTKDNGEGYKSKSDKSEAIRTVIESEHHGSRGGT